MWEGGNLFILCVLKFVKVHSSSSVRLSLHILHEYIMWSIISPAVPWASASCHSKYTQSERWLTVLQLCLRLPRPTHTHTGWSAEESPVVEVCPALHLTVPPLLLILVWCFLRPISIEDKTPPEHTASTGICFGQLSRHFSRPGCSRTCGRQCSDSCSISLMSHGAAEQESSDYNLLWFRTATLVFLTQQRHTVIRYLWGFKGHSGAWIRMFGVRQDRKHEAAELTGLNCTKEVSSVRTAASKLHGSLARRTRMYLYWAVPKCVCVWVWVCLQLLPLAVPINKNVF